MKRSKKARTKILISLLAVLLGCHIFSGISYAQDPGIPDTIRFDPWGTYIPCPPCIGHAIVPLVVYNDEYLEAMHILLWCTGPISWDSAVFVGERAEHMTGKWISISGRMASVNAVAIGDTIPPGDGIIAYLHFTVQDTGLASVDTIIISEGPLDFTAFSDIYSMDVIPEVILAFEQYLSPQNSPPGDANASGEVDVVDVVFLINYLFRDGPEPAYPPCADPNVDCQVSVSDVVYLINYVLKSGTAPQLGCAY